MNDFNPSIRHILQVLLQAEQGETREVVFGPSCRNRCGEFSWLEGGVHTSMNMPDGLGGTQIREALISMTGLDQTVEFPKESNFVLEIPKSQFILEFPIDEEYAAQENTTWQRIRWGVSIFKSEGPIILRRTQ
jgi:hypothetical protein